MATPATLVVLVGAGVVRAGAAAAVRRAVDGSRLGVVNTFRAKGILRWDSPGHLGTAGLQQRDFELAGVADAELILASGVDEEEAPRAAWALAPVLDVPPDRLAAELQALAGTPPPPAARRLYEELSAVIQPLYRSDARPRNPARAASQLAEDLRPGGVVVAGADLAGFWIGRAFPTTSPGTVALPARRDPSFLSDTLTELTRRDPDRHVVAVACAPVDVPAGVDLRVWDDVDWSATEQLVEVAGPIVAWGGVAST